VEEAVFLTASLADH